jgi:FAD:protein FMN transferase
MRLTKKRKSLMHTFIEIGIVTRDGAGVSAAMEGAFDIFRRHEKRYNFFDPRSVLSKLNRRRTGKLSRELSTMLGTCLSMSEKSGGAFDITVGPLLRLWDFGAESPRIPEDREIRDILPLVDYRRITLDDNHLTLPEGVNLDLSGVVKGFAVDDACRFLRRRGFSHAMVNGGRNIRVLGKNKRGEAWRIGIVNPRNEEELVGILTLDDESVATSGDYENFFFLDGTRYHHLLDPKTGRPVSTCMSATVISPRAALADILSTTAFVLGPDRGKELLVEMGCQGVFITESGIEATKGLEGKLQLL